MKRLNTYINEWKANTNTVSSIKKIQYFIHKLTTGGEIKIFDEHWPLLDDYINKVYINGKHVELEDDGWTIKEYKPGTYEVYIEDIDNVTDCKYMFWNCTDLAKVPLFDTSKVENMYLMFANCQNLEDVPLFDTSKVKSMHRMFCNCYQLKEVPLFDTSKIIDMSLMFYGCNNLNEQTRKKWSQIYNFETHNKKQ